MDNRERSAGAQIAGVNAMAEVACPTIVMAGALIPAHVAALVGVVPVWIAFLSAAGLVYAICTVVHEAVHGSISGKTRSLFRLNDASGYHGGPMIGAPLTTHRKAHSDHSRCTNVHLQDPDLKLAGGSLLSVVQGAFRVLPLRLQHYAQRHWVQALRKERSVLFPGALDDVGRCGQSRTITLPTPSTHRAPFYSHRHVFHGIEVDMKEHAAPITRFGEAA